MKPGEPIDLEYTKRHGAMSAQYSIQDLYDLLVELVTNCDDSYHGLHVDGKSDRDGGSIVIEIEPRRKGSSIVRVRDRAAGFRDLAEKLRRVGERTSRSGDRGFMARGLKDCAALGKVIVETIVDGRYDKAEITPQFQMIPHFPGSRPGRDATSDDRKHLGVNRGNGTVVTVELEPGQSVKKSETLRRDLIWHYALRDLMGPESDSIVKLGYGVDRVETLSWSPPPAELVHDREYPVPGYEGLRFRFQLWKAEQPLEDPPDPRCRHTGILIKGERAVHGVSFLKKELERDSANEYFFGRIECAGIDELAAEWSDRLEAGESHPEDNPILLIDPNRRRFGLEDNHPFTQALYQQPIEILKEEFKKHRAAERQRQEKVEAKETTKRLKKLAREATRFMREKLEEAGALGPGETVRTTSFARKGVGISPEFTQIEVGDTREFIVRVDRKLDLPAGTAVKVTLSKAAEKAVELVGGPTDLEPDPLHEDLFRGMFTLRGTRTGDTVQIGCQVDGLDPVYAQVQVIAPGPKEVEIPDGFSFERKSYTVRPGQRKKLLVRARFDGPVAVPPSLSFSVDDQSAVLLRKRQPLEVVPDTTFYEGSVVVEGKIVNTKTRIKAVMNARTAIANLSVVERQDDDDIEIKFELVDHSLGKDNRAIWDREQPNRLLITTTHESVGRYAGKKEDGYPGQHSHAFRVLLAELISDNVCRRIAEEQLRAMPMQLTPDHVYRLHTQLMREFTPIAHRVQLSASEV